MDSAYDTKAISYDLDAWQLVCRPVFQWKNRANTAARGMRHLSFSLPAILPAFLLACLLSSPAARAADNARVFTVSTEDTSVSVHALDGGLAVSGLKDSKGYDWLAGMTSTIPLIASAEVDGRTVPLKWKLTGSAGGGPGSARVELIFTCDNPALEARSAWEAFPGPGPVEHFLTISNRGPATVLLPMQKNLVLDLHAPDGNPLEHFWVEKGASIPTKWGTHLATVSTGYTASLVSGITWPYTKDTSTKPNDPMPWTTLVDGKAGRGVYMGIDFSGLVRIGLAAENSSRVKAVLGQGSDDTLDAEYRTRLAPGMTYFSPPSIVGCYRGDIDDGCNRLRRWVEAHVRPASPKALLPVLVNNSWGSGMAANEPLARSMIDLSAQMGLEMFHIDAGWYRAVGDWNPDGEKFPNGIAPVADYSHSKGLKFGLWIAWTQGGHMTYDLGTGKVLSVFDDNTRSWFPLSYDPKWKTKAFVGADVCLGSPEAAGWCTRELRRCMKEYKLDLLEHDQRMIVDKCGRTNHLHTASSIDVTYHAALGYYKVYDALRAENPGLLFENCVNGANMLDFGILRRTHYTSITDHYDPMNNRRAFYDSVFYMPPSMCECYIENHPGKTIANFKYMLRSGMMGWCTVMLDMAKWSPEQAAAGKRQFDLYKARLRPLINSANLYHVSQRPDGVNWDAIEYFDPAAGKGAVMAFRGRKPDEPRHLFRLKGLDPAARYELTFEDGTSKPATSSGRDLMEQGVAVELPETDSSEIVWIEPRQ